MPKCPKCENEIDHILAQTDATQEITKNTTEIDWSIDTEWVTYACPNCNDDIFNSFDDAVEFMKGE